MITLIADVDGAKFIYRKMLNKQRFEFNTRVLRQI